MNRKKVIVNREVHEAQAFPSRNPSVGNGDKDGNLVFVVDDKQIPHRVLFRNKDEYEIIDWIFKKQRDNINLIQVDWNQYINNIKTLRGDKIEDKRKVIKLYEQQMQVEPMEQSEVQIIDINQTQQNQIIRQQNTTPADLGEWKKRKPLGLKIKQKQTIIDDSQVIEELHQHLEFRKEIYTDDQMIQDLQDVLSFDFDQENSLQNNPALNIQNVDYILILPQFPPEVKQQQIQTLQKKKNLMEELQKGCLYLSQEQLTNLDKQIGQYLMEIRFEKKIIQYKGKNFTMSSPMCVLTEPHPIDLIRQWFYFKDKEQVKYYMIHSQALWYLQCQIKSKPEYEKMLMEIVNGQLQNYMNRWISLIIDDNQTNWFEISEGELVKASETAMINQIRNKYDSNISNYTMEHKENIWFTNSQVRSISLKHKVYKFEETLVTYLKIDGQCYFTNLKTQDILLQMLQYGINLNTSLAFEVVQTQDVICWLCGRVFASWNTFYVHECQQSQRALNLRELLQSWDLC